MRRLLAALMVLGLVAVACSGAGRPAPTADTDQGEVGEAQPAGVPVLDPVHEVAPGLDDASVAPVVEPVGGPGDALPTIPAEEMSLDEVNVGYSVELPAPSQAARPEVTRGEALGAVVNWIPFESGVDMGRAMEAGDIDISLSQDVASFATMVTAGSDLLLVGVAASYTGDGLRAVGDRRFGVISTTAAFAAEYPDAVAGFLQMTEDANVAYNRHREPFIDAIARASGLTRAATIALLDTLAFPEKDAQLSEEWLGGTVQQVMKEQMDSLVAQGEIESALSSYAAFVDTRFLEAVN